MIIITGFTGIGKTYLGSGWSNYLHIPHIDLDLEIERTTEKAITEVFEQVGEVEFRNIENRVLVDILNNSDPNSILSVGGGTPCFNMQMELLKRKGLVIYLEQKPKEILRKLRAEQRSTRPVLKGLSDQGIIDLFNTRRPFYEQAHLKIPLQWAKSPELLTMALNLFTKQHPDLIYLHNFL